MFRLGCRVMVFDINSGNFLRELNTCYLSEPCYLKYLAADPDGQTFWVTDWSSGVFQHLRPDGSVLGAWTQLGVIADPSEGFQSPAGISVFNQPGLQTVVTMDTNKKRINVFTRPL